MNIGFYLILSAQFLSALADNTLLFTAIALLRELKSPSWHEPLLLQFFVISYIVLAPFVGSIADSFPKGRVMFISNTIKFLGCTTMLFGMQPLYAYGIVGIGAAAYSPAKYGILSEYLPAEDLVKANGWMEGSTVMAIVLGGVLGAIIPKTGIEVSIIFVTLLYFAAAIFNLFIPKLPKFQAHPIKNPLILLLDFWHSFKVLWVDKQGQVSLAVTTLFWGAGATMRLIVLLWAAFALGFDHQQATYLTVVVAVGIAAGSIFAGKYVKLEDSMSVLPAGIMMGLLVMLMVVITEWHLGIALLFAIGILSGYFVVPLNALLQHRGHLLIGSGHSIAVQNFNENIGILIMSGAYTMMLRAEVPINTIVFLFGLFVLLTMGVINRFYRNRITAQEISANQ
jgi:MFS transporter, LPLT family, lysophospholipid transporter